MSKSISPLVSRSRRLRLLVGLAALATLCTPVATWAALTANVTTTGTITGGALALLTSATPSFAVTLDGTDKTPTYAIPITITDPRGTGAGWNVTITSTTFNTGTKQLSTSASTTTSLITACAGGSTCTDITNSIVLPIAVPAAGVAPAAVKIFNAALNTGMGQLTVTPTVTVSVPANAFAGVYTSLVTVAVVNGP